MAATVLVVEDERKLRDGPAADDRLEATWALSYVAETPMRVPMLSDVERSALREAKHHAVAVQHLVHGA